MIRMGLSTQALKPDSLEPDRNPNSMWSCLSSTRHVDYAHCITGLNHCREILSLSTAGSSDPDHGRVEAEWSLDLDLDPRSASDQDSRSCVESPNEVRTTFTIKQNRTLYLNDLFFFCFQT